MQAMNPNQAAQILHSAPVGIVVLDTERKVTWANELAHTLLGLGDGELVNKSFSQTTSAIMQRVVGQDGVYYVAASGNRAERWLHCRDQGLEQGAAKYFTDITELRRLQAQQERIAQQLQELATIDPNTGLFTPRALMQNLEPLVSRSRRYGNPLSVMVLSIVGLDQYNAAPRGPRAPQVLLAVGHMLKDQMRWADMISRAENNDFVMVLPETSTDSAQPILEKIRANLASLSVPDATDGIKVEARFGLASWHKGDDPQQLLQRAHNSVGSV